MQEGNVETSTTKKRDNKPSKTIQSCFCTVLCVNIFYTAIITAISLYLLIEYIRDPNSAVFVTPNILENINYNRIISLLSAKNNHNHSITQAIPNNLTRKDVLNLDSNILKRKSGRNFIIPEEAIKINDHTYYLGTTSYNNKYTNIKGFTFLLLNENKDSPSSSANTKDENNNSNNTLLFPKENQLESDLFANGLDMTTCSDFLALGTRWKGKTPPKFSVDYFNPFGFTIAYLEKTITSSMNTWQQFLKYPIFGNNDPNHLADGSDTIFPDGKNEIDFESIDKKYSPSSKDTLAAVTVWGRFDGLVNERFIFEVDITINDNIPYSSTTQVGTYNFQNVLVHLLGNWCGLATVHEKQCNFVTMYDNIEKREISKIDLNYIDVNALQILYNEYDPLLFFKNNNKGSSSSSSSSSNQANNNIMIKPFSSSSSSIFFIRNYFLATIIMAIILISF